MKKTLSVLSLIIALVMMLGLLASCSSNKAYSRSADEDGFELYAADGKESAAYSGDFFGEKPEQTSGTDAQSMKTQRKIIEYVTYRVQTKEYDSFIDLLYKEIDNLGGYVESSDISGGNLNYCYNRSADFVIRIPLNSSGDFSAFVSENSTVTSTQTSTEDATLEYVDTESRVNALIAEKEALESMLSKAESVEDILAVRSQLSDIICDIEAYKSRLRTIDDLSEYTTITLSVDEVERTVIVEKQSRLEKMLSDLKENCINVGEGILNFLIFLVTALPYILVFALIGLVIFLIIRGAVKRKKAKKAKKAALEAARKNEEDKTDAE